MSNFDLKTFLAENKLTFDSKVISERATDKYKVTCGNHTNKAFEKVVNSNKLTATPYKLKNGFIINQGDIDVVGKILDREMIPHTIDNIDNKRAETSIQEDYNTGPDMNVLKQLGINTDIDNIVSKMIQAVKSGKVEEEALSTTDKLVKTLADMLNTSIEKHQAKLQDGDGIAETEVEEQFGGETTSAAAGGFDVLAGYLKTVIKKGGEAGKKAAEFLKTLPAGAGHAMRNEEYDGREDDELTPEELANKHAGSPMHKEELTREEELKAEINAMFDSSTDETLSELSEKEKEIEGISMSARVEAGVGLTTPYTNDYKVTFNYEGTEIPLVFRPDLETAEEAKRKLEATKALDGYELEIKKLEREPSKYTHSRYLRDPNLD